MAKIIRFRETVKKDEVIWQFIDFDFDNPGVGIIRRSIDGDFTQRSWVMFSSPPDMLFAYKLVTDLPLAVTEAELEGLAKGLTPERIMLIVDDLTKLTSVERFRSQNTYIQAGF